MEDGSKEFNRLPGYCPLTGSTCTMESCAMFNEDTNRCGLICKQTGVTLSQSILQKAVAEESEE